MCPRTLCVGVLTFCEPSGSQNYFSISVFYMHTIKFAHKYCSVTWEMGSNQKEYSKYFSGMQNLAIEESII